MARGNKTPPRVNPNRLAVPRLERNLLLSPPGSPPLGWVHSREEGPAPGGCFDLALAVQRHVSEGPPEASTEAAPAETALLPKIVVQDVDGPSGGSTGCEMLAPLVDRLAAGPPGTSAAVGELHLHYTPHGLHVFEPLTVSHVFLEHGRPADPASGIPRTRRPS